MSAFDIFLRGLGQQSAVKTLILKTLWGEDAQPFPKPWVSSAELLRITGQKYFDRRTRELRDQSGVSIENAQVGGQYAYRLLSPALGPTNPREYLSESEKVQLFAKYRNQCQICGKTAQGGIRGLQADHKVPLIRGGTKDVANWQPVCNHCNVGKRGACADCEDDCQLCPWAFPERVGHVSLVRLPPEIRDLIGGQFGHDQHELELGILTLIRRGLGLN
jgi:5-methylcytosine-specific restriction endonuclease McrA